MGNDIKNSIVNIHQMKLDLFKKEKHFKKENYQINKNIYWNILLSVFFFLIIIIMIFGFVFFRKISIDANIKSEDNTKTNEENRKIKIDKVLNYFKDKETKSIETVSNSAGIVDPSL